MQDQGPVKVFYQTLPKGYVFFLIKKMLNQRCPLFINLKKLLGKQATMADLKLVGHSDFGHSDGSVWFTYRLCLLSDSHDLQTNLEITHAGWISFGCSDCTTFLVDCPALSHTEKERTTTEHVKNTQTNKRHYKLDPNILAILSSDCVCILALLDLQNVDALITSNWHHCPVFHVSLIFAYFQKNNIAAKPSVDAGQRGLLCLYQSLIKGDTNQPAEHLAVDLSLKATGECWFCWCETSPSEKRTLYVYPSPQLNPPVQHLMLSPDVLSSSHNYCLH